MLKMNEVIEVESVVRRIEVEEVRCAINRMKIGTTS